MTLHSSGNNGQLWRALAISLAVHALLLWPDAPRRLPERAAGVLVATLRPVEGAARLAESVALPPPGPEHAAASARPRTQAMPALAAVAPEPTFVAPPVPAGNTSTRGGAERSTMAASVSSAATAAAAVGSGEVGADADGRRQYRLALAREARRYKRYPERALLAGIGGTVEVRVEHGAGAMPVTRLARSSGDESLDAAALEMMRLAAPRTTLPEPLRGRVFDVVLPVIFDANEE